MSRYCDICGAALPKDERDRRIAELENRPHDEVLLHDMELMQKRIVELENAPYGGQGKLVAENALLTTRIAELEAENKLLRKTEGHYIGCPLRVKLAAGIAPMCTPCTCNEIANKKAEAAEAKLAKVLEGMEEIARSGDIEGFGEFIRGQASGWNQCRAQVQAILKEARS